MDKAVFRAPITSAISSEASELSGRNVYQDLTRTIEPSPSALVRFSRRKPLEAPARLVVVIFLLLSAHKGLSARELGVLWPCPSMGSPQR